MNIIYIHSHDTGRYVQPYGFPVSTPNLQRLAEGGIIFRKAFCAAPTCSPSRAALLTGQAPHSAGMFGLAHRGWKLNDYNQHIIHTLHDCGYSSALVGVQHIASTPITPNGAEDIGYEKILKTREWSAEAIGDAAVDYINAEHESPFFLTVGFFETHRGFGPASPEFDPAFIQPPATLPDTAEVREDMAAFKTSAKRLDTQIGKVLEALDAAGIAEETLVIATTDHGIPVPGAKCTLTDHGMGVMLIMRGPNGFEGGRAIEGMVSHIDVFPTICDLLEIDRPHWLQGTSFMPLVRGETDEVNVNVFGEVTFHGAYEPMRCVRTSRYKYIRRFGDYRTPILSNDGGGGGKQVRIDHGLLNHRYDAEELYDLIFDPNEAHNMAYSSELATVKADLAGRLEDWMRITSDPLLDGPIPLSRRGTTSPLDSDYSGGDLINCEGKPVKRDGFKIFYDDDGYPAVE